MQTNVSHSPIYNSTQSNASNPSAVHHAIQQSSLHDTNPTANPNPFAAGAPPPLNLFPPGSIPPNALTALLNAQQQLPFQGVNNPLPANFPLPPWMQPAAAAAAAAAATGQTQAFATQQQQQRPLLNHSHLQEDQQMRLRQQQQQHDFNTNQFQQPYSALNSRLPQQQQQQRSKLREPYLRVKNLSRKYSYRDVKLLFADYKLRLEDIKMINDQNGERTGKHSKTNSSARLPHTHSFISISRRIRRSISFDRRC